MWNHIKEFFNWIGFLTLCFALWIGMLYLVGTYHTLVPFLICFIGLFPLLEEWFKSNHSNTFFKAHLFGLLEFSIVALAVILTPSFTMDKRVGIILAKVMSLFMHFSTGMLYYRYNKNDVFWGCVGLHMLFNAIIHYAHIQSFEIVLFAPYALLYISSYFVKSNITEE